MWKHLSSIWIGNKLKGRELRMRNCKTMEETVKAQLTFKGILTMNIHLLCFKKLLTWYKVGDVMLMILVLWG